MTQLTSPHPHDVVSNSAVVQNPLAGEGGSPTPNMIHATLPAACHRTMESANHCCNAACPTHEHFGRAEATATTHCNPCQDNCLSMSLRELSLRRSPSPMRPSGRPASGCPPARAPWLATSATSTTTTSSKCSR
ncbi:hypothetical protein NFJ02_36g92310 [Pycnococcus provasolii]